MPPRGQGPRLWERPGRRAGDGRITHRPVWLIVDGRHNESTGCRLDDRAGAEKALAEYIARKHVARARGGERHPHEIPVADALALYAADIVPRLARPAECAARIERLLAFFGDSVMSEINGALCRRYAERRGGATAARRELEDLRAAFNHFHREGHVRVPIGVVLPARPPSRERWLTRAEAARLVRHCWRFRERQNGATTRRFTRRHVARFILIGLYAGRRAGAIVEAALSPQAGRGWIDLQRGIFHPRARIMRTKKRQPPIRLPLRLLAHLRRWKRRGQRYAVEWNDAPIRRMARAFRAAVHDAGLGTDVTPHTLRHTSATWMMQRGADPWAAAGYLGMSLETLIRTYGHHHPDHLKAAWGVFDRPGGEIKPGPKAKTGRKRPARAKKRKRRPPRRARRK